MARQIVTGTPVVDHFSAFENDGYTKRSGLTAGDFTVTAYQDATVVALTVTITEVGSTGEYEVAFTPATGGFYSIQALIAFNKEIWEGEYEVAPDSIADEVIPSLDQLEADLTIVKALLHENAMLDSQTYISGQMTSARLRVFDDAVNVPATPGGSETTGLLAEFSLESTYTAGGFNNKFTLKRVLP